MRGDGTVADKTRRVKVAHVKISLYISGTEDHVTLFPFVLGVPAQILPLSGFPAGKVRLRLRNRSYAQAFVRPPNGGIRRFWLGVDGGKWVPNCEIGANVAMGGVTHE